MGALRKGHSALYLAPGAHVPVSPYESAFVYFSEGNKGVPILFRSPLTLDVERHMREAGVMPKDARREPSDSVWNEFSFLSYLYGSLAAALHEGRGEDVALWRTRLAAFWNEHASRWLPAFMEQTQEMAPVLPYGEEYAIFAEIGQMILEAIASDVAACAESRLLEDIGSPNDLTAN